MDKLGQFYNVDKIGMSLDHQAPGVLTKRSQKKVRYSISGNKAEVTVVEWINVIGQVLSSFVIFDAKIFNMEWTMGEVPGTTYGLGEWICNYLKSG